MLKFDDLSLTPSRSRTPQSSSRGKEGSRTAKLKDMSSRNGSSNSLQRTITAESGATSPTWVAEEEDDLGRGDNNNFDWGLDEEDEFGLPSLTSARYSKKSPSGRGTRIQPPSAFGYFPATSRPTPHKISSSVDIGDERGGPQYPVVGKKIGEKILRPQYKEVLRDPANSLHLIEHPPLSTSATAKEREAHSTRQTRVDKFKRILQASTVNLTELRSAAWSGIPHEVRSMAWMVLLGYLPASSERRVTTLEKKRKEYLDGIKQVFKDTSDRPGSSKSHARTASGAVLGRARGLDETVWHQISIDVPRTSPHLPLYGFETTQRSLERILYLWAMRHPASGYVQGINDLVTPFWQVFLGSYITDYNIEAGMDPGQLPRAVLDAVEADTYWCLTKLLDGIQDNYIHAQPGIVRQVNELQDLIARIDFPLSQHFTSEGVEFMQFSFRWMNCLLMREISVQNTIRMWDTYLVRISTSVAALLYLS